MFYLGQHNVQGNREFSTHHIPKFDLELGLIMSVLQEMKYSNWEHVIIPFFSSCSGVALTAVAIYS